MPLRFSTKSLLAITTLVAISIVALIFAGPIWSSAFYTVALLIIVGAIIAAVNCNGAARAFWIGFVILGGGYLYLATLDGVRDSQNTTWEPRLVTSHLLIRADQYVATIRPKDPAMSPQANYRYSLQLGGRNYGIAPEGICFVRTG